VPATFDVAEPMGVRFNEGSNPPRRATMPSRLLLFGDRDTETPMASCFPLVEELRGKGAPLAWHSYSGATHAGDKQGEIANGYVFDQDATRDATRRMIDCFNQHR
jgi:dienelactone hydrolase